jgi:hypothetical protein
MYILLLKGCPIEMENTVKHFDELSVTASAGSVPDL